MTIKVGDTVRYLPVMLADDASCEGVVEMVEPGGKIFKMDMVAITTVDHWVPAHECTVTEVR